MNFSIILKKTNIFYFLWIFLRKPTVSKFSFIKKPMLSSTQPYSKKNESLTTGLPAASSNSLSPLYQDICGAGLPPAAIHCSLYCTPALKTGFIPTIFTVSGPSVKKIYNEILNQKVRKHHSFPIIWELWKLIRYYSLK